MNSRGVSARRIPRRLAYAMIAGVIVLAAAPLPAVAQKDVSFGQASVSNALQKQAGGRLKTFYKARGYEPLWVRKGTIGREAETFLTFIANADLDGLDVDDYQPEKLRTIIGEARAGGTPEALARAELALSKQFARYVDDMRRPRNNEMRYLDHSLMPKRRKADAVLRAASFNSSFADYLGNMAWMSPHYSQQRKLMAKARINGASPEKLARLRLNLDRARVLPGPWTMHIVVDAASGRLWYYQAGKEKGSMRVVVGKPETPTPMLAGMMQYAILNPYWNIPTDLAQTLIAPKVLSGRSLSSMNMEALSDWSATPAKLSPKSIDWQAVASGAQTLRIRELPGKANSMGRAKFMFPNDEGIYLHDTPDRDLLSKPNRHFSNGCVRLEDAAGLGRWLLGKPITTVGKQPEQAVPLRVPIPVYLTYLTANEGKNGVVFLDDVYGRDR
ncbi:MAG: L,D-transpeptidase family protein [Sphingorhabdus sp.]